MKNEEYQEIKILCIEDENLIRENQVQYLRRLFPIVYEASNSIDALKIIQENKPNIVISDIEIDETNGLELIRKVREYDKKTKFIVLSAYSNKEYLLDAKDLGLIKYLIKPIDHETFYPILLKCVEEIYAEQIELIAISNDCNFDLINSQLIYKNNEKKLLTKYETNFLELIYKNSPNVVTYNQIENEIWKDNIMTESSLRTLVKSLRKKLPNNTIKNLSKIGYRFNNKIQDY